MTVKLSSSLPDDSRDGLASYINRFVDRPADTQVAIVVLRTKSLTTNMETGNVIPTAAIRAIEVITQTTDAYEMQRLLRRAYERRTGKVELPLEMEQAIDEVNVDRVTGEINKDYTLTFSRAPREALSKEDLDLLIQAAQHVIGAQLGSGSLLQRKLLIGFAKSQRLMQQLELAGVVGKTEGSRSRDVLFPVEELAEAVANIRSYWGDDDPDTAGDPGDHTSPDGLGLHPDSDASADATNTEDDDEAEDGDA